MRSTQSTISPLAVKNAELFFHSTLEPKHQRCSASLSQSQRSFTFVNSISTLLNKGGTLSSKQETLSSQAPNMLCPCLFLLTQNKRFKHSSQLTQCKLVVHVTCSRHPVNCKGTHKEVKNFLLRARSAAAETAILRNPGGYLEPGLGEKGFDTYSLHTHSRCD